MTNMLSRFTLRYPAVLVYMLQGSEYYVGDYLDWYHRTSNFSNVERAGRLKYTKKTLGILAIAWLIYVLLFSGLAWTTVIKFSEVGFWPIVFLFALPYLLAYLIIIPVLLIKYFIQKPFELLISTRLKSKIKKLSAKRIAIAGSYGKTTMREILLSVTSAGAKVAAPGGSLNTFWGIYRFVKSLKGDEELLIFELGEYYPGDIRKLSRMVQPDMGIITGINEAHLKRFKTLDRTVATIFELVDYLGDKPVYINGDDELARSAVRGNFQLYSSKTGTLGWQITSVKTDLSGLNLVLKHDKKDLKFHSELMGKHLAGSLVAAISIAATMGLNYKQLTDGVGNTKPYSRRFNKVSDSAGIVILDDSYNGNPSGVRAVIDFLAELKNYRRFYVTSGLVEMGSASKHVHYQMAKELVAAKIEQVVLIKNSSTELIAAGLKRHKYSGKVTWFNTMQEARDKIPLMLASGDLVLFSTSWPDQYQ